MTKKKPVISERDVTAFANIPLRGTFTYSKVTQIGNARITEEVTMESNGHTLGPLIGCCRQAFGQDRFREIESFPRSTSLSKPPEVHG